ncbi:MAG: protocatechuate 3,4-dioxygenase [Acidobacteria bacterium]|nr:protocatechuate 3,4-dioxygenase [Acidobacteriota bacterium]
MKFLMLMAVLSLSILAFPQAPTVAEKNAPSKITIANKDEAGERLTVSGVIFGADGKTPLANASVYVYHTDANGRYTPGPTDDNRNPRLRGYMRTDAQGRYEYNTIKPAPYPGDGPPAHIHYHVNAPGYQDRVFEIVFEGDPKISKEIRASAAKEDSAFSIRPLTRTSQGGWHCTQNVTLRK